MLLEKFKAEHAWLNDTEFHELSIEALNDKINNYKFVENKDFEPSNHILYNERTITLDIFRTETIFAMLIKFGTEVTWPILKIDLSQDDALANKLVTAGFSSAANYIFEGYQNYPELILADEINKKFTIISKDNLTENYYRQVFTDLSDLFFSVLQKEGYDVFPTDDFRNQETSFDPQYVN